MQSAMSSLVDVSNKHNEQELEDELADLLKNDKPNISKTGKHHIPGIISIVYKIILTIINEKTFL